MSVYNKKDPDSVRDRWESGTVFLTVRLRHEIQGWEDETGIFVRSSHPLVVCWKIDKKAELLLNRGTDKT